MPCLSMLEAEGCGHGRSQQVMSVWCCAHELGMSSENLADMGWAADGRVGEVSLRLLLPSVHTGPLLGFWENRDS